MLEARNLWELVVRRAEASPDAQLAVDEDERTLTFAELVGEAERAAAGLAAHRRRRGHGRVVAAARRGSSRWCSSARCPGSARCRTRCCRSTASARSASSPGRRRASCSSCRGTWRGFDYEEHGPRRSPLDNGLRVLVADRALPQGDPSTLPPPLPPPDDARRRTGPLAFYTSGTTADPKGARHTDATIMAAREGMASAGSTRPRTERAWCSRSPTSAASPGCSPAC